MDNLVTKFSIQSTISSTMSVLSIQSLYKSYCIPKRKKGFWIEALCQRVLVLNEGKIYFDGSLEQLRKKILPDGYLAILKIRIRQGIHGVGYEIFNKPF